MFDCSKYEYVNREVFSRRWRNDDRPLLYFWQVFHRDADRISIVNVGTVPLAIHSVFDT